MVIVYETLTWVLAVALGCFVVIDTATLGDRWPHQWRSFCAGCLKILMLMAATHGLMTVYQIRDQLILTGVELSHQIEGAK